MGAKPVIQLAPFILTKAIRHDTTWSKGPVWFYIRSNLKQWSRLGSLFDLPVISEETIPNGAFSRMKINAPKYYAKVTEVIHLDGRTISLRIKVGRRLIRKRIDNRYGGIINYLDSGRNL